MTTDDMQALSNFIAHGNDPLFGPWQLTKNEAGRLSLTYCGERVDHLTLPKPVREYPFTPAGYNALLDDIADAQSFASGNRRA